MIDSRTSIHRQRREWRATSACSVALPLSEMSHHRSVFFVRPEVVEIRVLRKYSVYQSVGKHAEQNGADSTGVNFNSPLVSRSFYKLIISPPDAAKLEALCY